MKKEEKIFVNKSILLSFIISLVLFLPPIIMVIDPNFLSILNKIFSLLCALSIIICFVLLIKDDIIKFIFSYLILVFLIHVILISIYDFLLNYKKSSEQDNNEFLLKNKEKTIDDTSNESQIDSYEKNNNDL